VELGLRRGALCDQLFDPAVDVLHPGHQLVSWTELRVRDLEYFEALDEYNE
jgi:hypothetical protein